MIFMRAMLKIHGVTDRTVWVVDSFEGVPVPRNFVDGDNLSHLDSLSVSLAAVKSNFEKFDLLDDQVKFLKGRFCDILPSAPIDEIAILRLDGDLYHSTSLTNLYHKVGKGGYIIIDDYYSWPECGSRLSAAGEPEAGNHKCEFLKFSCKIAAQISTDCCRPGILCGNDCEYSDH